LTYARDICDIMGIDKAGNVMPMGDVNSVPSFGAAADGDADRNVSVVDFTGDVLCCVW
jgi:hypothetical protein